MMSKISFAIQISKMWNFIIHGNGVQTLGGTIIPYNVHYNTFSIMKEWFLDKFITLSHLEMLKSDTLSGKLDSQRRKMCVMGAK